MTQFARPPGQIFLHFTSRAVGKPEQGLRDRTPGVRFTVIELRPFLLSQETEGTMDPFAKPRQRYSRREVLRSTASVLVPLVIPPMKHLSLSQQPISANGSADPYPIPWLDKNGSHNQPAGANLEPSNIYHFKGRVARCSTFTGIGTDNQGNRIAFGSPTTDYGLMHGEYWGARTAQQGTFTHI